MNRPASQSATSNTAFENRVSSAIEQQSNTMIPADFAARVTAQATALPRRSRAPRANYARAVSIFFSALLVVALFVLAPHAQPSFASLGFDLEMTAVVVLSALLYWLTQVRKESV